MPRKSNKSKKAVRVISLLLLLVIAGVGIYQAYYFYLKKAYPIEYKEIVTEQAEKYHIEPSMVYAVIRTESNFRASAVSDAGAVGLMQIMPNTFEWLQKKAGQEEMLKEDSLTDPKVNIAYGVYLLSILMNEYDNDTTVLSAYNAGMGTVSKWLTDKDVSADGVTLKTVPYEETAQYVQRVLKSKDMYNKLYFNS